MGINSCISSSMDYMEPGLKELNSITSSQIEVGFLNISKVEERNEAIF